MDNKNFFILRSCFEFFILLPTTYFHGLSECQPDRISFWRVPFMFLVFDTSVGTGGHRPVARPNGSAGRMSLSCTSCFHGSSLMS
jgi:hypothetical protein